MHQFRYILAGLACLLSVAASAHWTWVDKDGRKVFSDRPPPLEIPEKDILERPPVVSSAPPPRSAASAPRLSGVDKELTDKKKKAEEAETGKRKGEEEKIQKARAENCVRAKRAKTGFESGRPMTRSNEKGEPELIDAATRSAELARIEAIIESDCK